MDVGDLLRKFWAFESKQISRGGFVVGSYMRRKGFLSIKCDQLPPCREVDTLLPRLSVAVHRDVCKVHYGRLIPWTPWVL